MLLVGLFTSIHHSNPCAHWAFKKNGGRVCVLNLLGKGNMQLFVQTWILYEIAPLVSIEKLPLVSVLKSHVSLKEQTDHYDSLKLVLLLLPERLKLILPIQESHVCCTLYYNDSQRPLVHLHFTETCCIAVYRCIKSTRWYCSVILLYL